MLKCPDSARTIRPHFLLVDVPSQFAIEGTRFGEVAERLNALVLKTSKG